MDQYVGLDVSLKETFVCVVDACGEVVCENSVGTTPETIAEFIEKKAPSAVRIGLESGLLSTWLWHGLRALGLPVVCLDARHAASALSMQVNKTDRNDAAGLAQIVRTGWYREVEVKSLACHEVRADLLGRARLVASRRDVENQMRGLLKPFGPFGRQGPGQGFRGAGAGADRRCAGDGRGHRRAAFGAPSAVRPDCPAGCAGPGSCQGGGSVPAVDDGPRRRADHGPGLCDGDR